MAKSDRSNRTPQTPARLRRRLEESEQQFAAIRNGDGESLARPLAEQRTFTLQGVDQPYRQIVERMHEGALIVVGDGTILFCNRRFAEMVGRTSDQIVGANLRLFVAAGGSGAVERLLAVDESTAELQVQGANGVLIPVQCAATSLSGTSMRTFAVVVSDLSQEQAERGLRESNRLKDEFLATLSHELRTPLNVILGWTRMLMAGHLSEVAQRHALELIDRNAQAQVQLVNDLVDMSKMSTGRMRLELEPLLLAPILEVAVENVRAMAETKGIRIDTAWADGDLSVLADAERAQQILWNLLSNAIKFTAAGGRINIRATKAEERAVVEITDTGVGIDPAFLPHVFERFRQADGSDTRRYGGLGLGLAIVRDLMLLHGGEVEARSDGLGTGSTFAVNFRLSAPLHHTPERRRHFRLPGGLAGHTVMLIDRHDDSRELLLQALRNAGCAVADFGAAAAAFPALERVRPSVIVMELRDAVAEQTAIERLRAHPAAPLRSIPAIAIVDGDFSESSARQRNLYQGFVSRPIDPHVLVQTIQDVLRSANRSIRRRDGANRTAPSTMARRPTR